MLLYGLLRRGVSVAFLFDFEGVATGAAAGAGVAAAVGAAACSSSSLGDSSALALALADSGIGRAPTPVAGSGDEPAAASTVSREPCNSSRRLWRQDSSLSLLTPHDQRRGDRFMARHTPVYEALRQAAE